MGRREWGGRIAAMIVLLFVVSACNVDDGALVRPGQGDEDSAQVDEDSGEPDVGQPDSGQPDSGEPDVDEPAPTCDDGVQNGDETGRDCGGDCAPCGLGQGCGEAADCESGYCTGNVCVDASCADVECAEDEACYRAVCYLACEDADGCDPNSRCYQGACVPLDCSTAECTESETCYRGVCYGACTGDEGCSEEGAECVEGSCVVPTCNDGLQNGDESDVDCGGAECDGCAVGKSCEVIEDCQAPIEAEFGPCEFDANVCAREGTQSRAVTRFICGDSGTCEAVEGIETRTCTRDPGEEECALPEIGRWSECEAVRGEPVCSARGERRRVDIVFTCNGAVCEPGERVETEACERQVEGITCGESSTTEWSSCRIPSNSCSSTQTRTRTDRLCVEGECQSVGVMQEQDCYAEAGTSCLGPMPMDTRECVRGTWMVTEWSTRCDGVGGCEAVSHTYEDGSCLILECSGDEDCGPGSCCTRGSCGPCLQVCQPLVECEASGGVRGCCNQEGTQCVPYDPMNPVLCIAEM